eukprot:scaffold28624_cov62-Phaeocystis_antarctica.AAC.6
MALSHPSLAFLVQGEPSRYLCLANCAGLRQAPSPRPPAHEALYRCRRCGLLGVPSCLLLGGTPSLLLYLASCARLRRHPPREHAPQARLDQRGGPQSSRRLRLQPRTLRLRLRLPPRVLRCRSRHLPRAFRFLLRLLSRALRCRRRFLSRALRRHSRFLPRALRPRLRFLPRALRCRRRILLRALRRFLRLLPRALRRLRRRRRRRCRRRLLEPDHFELDGDWGERAPRDALDLLAAEGRLRRGRNECAERLSELRDPVQDRVAALVSLNARQEALPARSAAQLLQCPLVHVLAAGQEHVPHV